LTVTSLPEELDFGGNVTIVLLALNAVATKPSEFVEHTNLSQPELSVIVMRALSNDALL
jgi:hypothetical protein